jgi:hypothetical protein
MDMQQTVNTKILFKFKQLGGGGGDDFEQTVAAILHLASRLLTWGPRTRDLGWWGGITILFQIIPN